MKNNRSQILRNTLYLMLGIAVYICLLILLTCVESASPDSSIQSFGDAFWYSVVTLTTVGYGDLYPITAFGKVLGVLFVLLSLGLLSFLLGAAVQMFTGQLLPTLKLRFMQRDKWFLFSQLNPASVTLAKSIQTEYPGAACLFPLSQKDKAPCDGGFSFYPGSITDAAALKDSDCSLFFIDDASGTNYLPAIRALSTGHPVYCRTEQSPEKCPDGLVLFNRYDICAQDYWQRHPLKKGEENIIIIGDGKYARRLVEQGLLVNVFTAGRRASYHLFGDWEEFCLMHPQLGCTLAIDRDDPQMDSIYFHTQSWSALLYTADRIILCSDDETENLRLLSDIRHYFLPFCPMHLRAESNIPSETVFGTVDAIYNAELVIHSRRTAAARMMHTIYSSNPGWTAPKWEELSDFTRLSNIAAADHLLTKIRTLLEDDSITELSPDLCKAAAKRYEETRNESCEEYRQAEHMRWMRFHSMYNWQYAPVRDNIARKHPLMLPYDQLPPEEQRKDDFAWELIGLLPDVWDAT